MSTEESDRPGSSKRQLSVTDFDQQSLVTESDYQTLFSDSDHQSSVSDSDHRKSILHPDHPDHQASIADEKDLTDKNENVENVTDETADPAERVPSFIGNVKSTISTGCLGIVCVTATTAGVFAGVTKSTVRLAANGASFTIGYSGYTVAKITRAGVSTAVATVSFVSDTTMTAVSAMFNGAINTATNTTKAVVGTGANATRCIARRVLPEPIMVRADKTVDAVIEATTHPLQLVDKVLPAPVANDVRTVVNTTFNVKNKALDTVSSTKTFVVETSKSTVDRTILKIQEIENRCLGRANLAIENMQRTVAVPC